MTADDDRYRLPRTVRPVHYELSIAPDLEAATFEGTAAIEVEVMEPVRTIVCNAAELDIHSAVLTLGDRDLTGAIAVDTDTERVAVTLRETVVAGRAQLTFRFSGTLNDKLRGFYRSTFTGADGATRVIATTQFEATDARRAFPCWDEPEAKATFAVELLIGDDHIGLSNTGTVAERPADGGRRWVRFGTTMKMSTYLVAWVVGPLELTEPVDVDGVPLRVACAPGRRDLAGFALEVGAHALRYFTEYFAIPYPGDKLDLVALPDFAFGAMENLGCVTFRETALLADPASASRDDLERIADVVSHEVAHMWFGDLVTMRWWNGIWLNEAFATFMEVKAVEAFRPEWERWVSFSIDRAAAMVIDGLHSTRPVEYPVVSPDEAEGMFDLLTYRKGGAVLRMLETYLGADRFRDGIRRYLDTHRYANTETTDLWDAIEATTGEPVRALMDTWIFTGGHPVISVSSGQGGNVTLSQKRFRYQSSPEDEQVLWHVPVRWRAGEAEQRLLLTGPSTTVPVDDAPLVVNSGGWGFFRTRYEHDRLAAITERIGALAPIERFNLVSDTWSSTLAGATSLADFLTLIGHLAGERDESVWEAAIRPVDGLHRLADDSGRGRVAGFVRRLIGPEFVALGWQPADGEAERAGTLRATLLAALGTIGEDTAVQKRCAELHDAFLDDRAAVAPDLISSVVSVVAWTGGRDQYDTFVERYRKAPTPQEEIRYLFALPKFRETALLQRTLDLTLTEIRTQDAPFVIGGALANRWNGSLAWSWLEQHWDEVVSRIPHNTTSHMLEGAVFLTEPSLAAEVAAFMAEHPVPHAQRLVEQILERLAINAAFRRREATNLAVTFPSA